jgi:ADP-heptose:LPS heptosyltransferase
VEFNKKIKAFLLKFLTRKQATNFEINNSIRILFLRYDRIGDMVITTPVFRELKKFNPKVKISVLASKDNSSVLDGNPYIEEVHLNNKNKIFKDLKTLLYLRKLKFDVCIEFDHSVIPHAILRLKVINPKALISVEKTGRYGVKGSELELYDYFTKKKKNSHFKDIWLETLAPFGVSPKSSQFDLFCTELQNKVASAFTSQFENRFLIGINLKGAVKGKKIEYKDLEQICKSLYEYDNNIEIIIMAPPEDFQRVRKDIIKIGLNYVQMSYKTLTILDVAALIKQMDLIITPDTSIVHIASTFNIPIVTIHENNQDSYKLFAPTSESNKTVFSASRNSLKGFSVNLLLNYCFELMSLSKKRRL